MSIDWEKYKPYFRKEEFDCKHTGKNKMLPEFLDVLYDIRKAYKRRIIITSGYRDPSHPVEVKKGKPGEHSFGAAIDAAVSGVDAQELIVIAYGYGIRRFGLNQKGGVHFLHMGYGDKTLNFPESIWTY